jgi:RNA recognition motif-containing protein
LKQQLYVGNLPLDITEDQLRDLFAGTDRQVESVTIRRKAKTGRSRGFGFVKMASESDAESAMAALNGTDIEGRSLKVGEAHRENRERSTGGGWDDHKQTKPKRRR